MSLFFLTKKEMHIHHQPLGSKQKLQQKKVQRIKKKKKSFKHSFFPLPIPFVFYILQINKLMNY
jgi:hypothetical protein